jgi:hypothetical protein
VSPVKYELGFYISEDGILHSHRRGNLNSYTLPYPFIRVQMKILLMFLEAVLLGNTVLGTFRKVLLVSNSIPFASSRLGYQDKKCKQRYLHLDICL